MGRFEGESCASYLLIFNILWNIFIGFSSSDNAEKTDFNDG